MWYRIGIDEWLRVPSVEDVFALGDCAGFLEQTGRPVLPALAQVRTPSFSEFCIPLFSLFLLLWVTISAINQAPP